MPGNEELTDVCKLSIFKDEEIVFFAQRGQGIDDRRFKVIKYIDVCLDWQVRFGILTQSWVHLP